MSRLPRGVVWVLRVLLPARDREVVLGDVEEEHAEVRQKQGRWRAWVWVWRQVAGSVGAGLVLRLRAAGVPGEVRQKGGGRMQTVAQDLRQGLRVIRRSPGLSAVVAVTLALGIAAVTIVFSVVDGVVLNPFPFPEPGRLVGVGTAYPRLDRGLSYFENLSPAEYVDIRESSRTLTDVVAWDMGNREITFGEVTENVFSGFWWADAFPTLGVRPAAGRGMSREEIERGERVAVLSHRLWVTRFGGSPDLVGSTVLVNGNPYTVVGIMPARTLIYGMDLWIPMPVGPEVFPRDRRQFQVLARLRPGVSLEGANEDLRDLAGRVEEQHGAAQPEYAGWRMVASTWNDINTGQVKSAAWILMGAVAFVLLLVCANVANLLLARSAARQKEFAIRSALGARSGRLLRQLLTESLILALAGGALGVALGTAGVRAVNGMVAAINAPVPGTIALNWRVLLLSAAVTVGAGVLFGLAPALRALRFRIQGTLQDEGPGSTGGSKLRLQRSLVGVEVALALVLLASGGLLMHSLVRLQSVDPGFSPENVLTMRLTLSRERYAPAAIDPFFRELERRVEEIPGVSAASTASQYPPIVFMQNPFWIEGRALVPQDQLPNAYTTLVGPDYIQTLGVRLVRGRTFSDADGPDAPRVAVLNEAAAQQFFPGENPIGRRLKLGGANDDAPWFEIVGVVGSTNNRGLDAPRAPELFASSRQSSGLANQFFLMIRTAGNPRAVLPAVRSVVQALDPQQPVYAIRTIEEVFRMQSATRRIAASAIAVFAAFALILAAVGIYSVVAYAVSQRTREIGVRMALGAAGSDVRRLIVRQALLPVFIGAAIGLAGSLAAGRALASLLFGIGASDAPTLASVLLLFLLIATLAGYIPARRASNLHPLAALRHERRGS